MVHVQGLTMSSAVTWTPEAEVAFVEMKIALQSPPTLGLPDPTKPYTQADDEREGCMISVLLQIHGCNLRPVAYFSARLDPVAAGLSKCLRATAAADKALMAHNPRYHGLCAIDSTHSTRGFAHPLRTKDVSLIRCAPSIYISHLLARHAQCHCETRNTLNRASLMPLPDDGEPHHCMTELDHVCSPRPDLTDKPLDNPDLILYVNGAAFRGINRVGFAVVSDSEILCSDSLPCHLSAEWAELVALTEACKIATGKSVTIYTDSRYAFAVAHDCGTL